MSLHRICLVGAGNISHIHAEALSRISGTEIVAVVDSNIDAARALAGTWGVPATYGSVEAAIAAQDVDCAHILVPPDLHHVVATPFLEAGIPVLVEKPLAASGTDCQSLVGLAERTGTVLGVNQNFVHHPAFRKLRDMVANSSMGRLRHVDCLYSVPLRQLDARQFGHWMFRKPLNILLEQAVHPLSQIDALVGEAADVSALAPPPMEISPGVPFHDSCSVSLNCARGQAHMHFAVGRAYPFWQIVAVCDDGVIVADILANRVFTYGRARWLEFVDTFLTGRRAARAMSRQALANAADYLLSTFRLKPRLDPFFLSMKGSIAAFYQALDAGTPPELDGRLGARLVDLCERIADGAFVAAEGTGQTESVGEGEDDIDIAILGGTGFIGGHVVERFLAAGFRIGVMARNTRNLPALFHDKRVTVIRGDICRTEDVERGIGNASIVVNLAHGGGGSSWEEIERTMVGSARLVAETCQRKGVSKLIHVSSIAALYLGGDGTPITGRTPVDPLAEQRGDYARGKTVGDKVLLEMQAREGLPVCILRPGVVIGEGGLPFHSAIGFYNNEQHCFGWNRGDNPLPFVLVEDVAEAIVLAAGHDGLAGRCYNLVGGIRMTAREYIGELSRTLHRPLRFHAQAAIKLQGVEVGKWIIKLLIGRAAPFPSYRDLKSRGLTAKFDCSDAVHDLGWSPVDDRATFIRRGIAVHGRRGAE